MMTYYQKKASEIRDLALAHPWGEDKQKALEEALREIAKDQRHACAEAVLDLPFTCDNVENHSAAMDAEIGEA